jgi:pimeloyl-ACP methyl ester carboxylesterase
MASAPPEGILMVGHSLILPGPAALMDSLRRTLPGKARSQTDLWRRALFSDELPAKRVAEFAARMGHESPRALSEARIPATIVSARREQIPVLVLSAERDTMIEHAMSRRTTYYHGATFRKVAGSGHAMMLDIKWKQTAEIIRDWLEDHKI